MKNIIMTLGAVFALTLATPVSAENYGIFEVGIVEQGSTCGLTAGDSTTLLMYLDGDTGNFVIGVTDPQFSFMNGKIYPVTLILDGKAQEVKGVGVNDKGLTGVAMLFNNPEVVYRNLRSAKTMRIRSGATDLLTLNAQNDFVRALDAMVACTVREMQTKSRMII